MKVMLISCSLGDVGLPPEDIGISRIYAYLKQTNNEAELLYLIEKTIEQSSKIIDMSYDVYGFSVYNTNLEYVLELSKIIKKFNPQSIIVYGSKFVTSCYKQILNNKYSDYFDLLILGDGEYTLNKLLNYLENNKSIESFAVNNPHVASKDFFIDKKPQSIDINILPLPDRTFLKYKNSNLTSYIYDSNGCCGNCSFCTEKGYHNWQGRSAEDLFNEVYKLYNEFGIRFFAFTSSSFEDPGNIGKKRIKDFCKMIKDAKLKCVFRCYIKANTFKNNEQDKNLLILMKEVGFNTVFIGIESGNNEDLLLYNKLATVDDNNTILKIMNYVNIYAGSYGFIMFNPYSTVNRIKTNYEFLIMNQPYCISRIISRLYVYENTEIYKKIKNDKLIKNTSNSYIDYLFIDNTIKKICNFIDRHFVNLKNFNEDLIISTIYGFSSLFKDNTIIDELENILAIYKKIIIDYFFMLYIENNFNYCEKKFVNFEKEIIEYNNKLILLRNKTLKHIVKYVK